MVTVGTALIFHSGASKLIGEVELLVSLTRGSSPVVNAPLWSNTSATVVFDSTASMLTQLLSIQADDVEPLPVGKSEYAANLIERPYGREYRNKIGKNFGRRKPF